MLVGGTRDEVDEKRLLVLKRGVVTLEEAGDLKSLDMYLVEQ